MKRVLTFLAILLLPLSVWAMTPVSDSDLSNVTGQAGVNINADLTMNVTIGTMAWGDADGISTSQWLGYSSMGAFQWNSTQTSTSNAQIGGGYVGVTGFNLTNLTIKARTGDNVDGYDSATQLKPITIDVATGGLDHPGVTFVRIGLGSLELKWGSMDLGVGFGAAKAGDGSLALDDGLLGRLYIGDATILIDPTSYVDIFAHGSCGVTMSLNVQLDEISFGAISWGDTDGLGDASTNPWIGNATTVSDAGYVGLRDLNLGIVTITGDVLIDVARIATNSIYGSHYAGEAVVHISFDDNFTLNVGGPITAEVVLSTANNLPTNTAFRGILGDIYISGLNAVITNGSWVDIWAH